jgi:osmotically-inducible protein OsmY
MSAHSELKEHGLAKPHTPWVKRPDTSRSADMGLAAAAAEAIEILTTVPQETITVTARHGWLHLEGTVNWQAQRTTVEDVTRHLPGVRGVIDSITINSVPTRTDPTTVLQ